MVLLRDREVLAAIRRIHKLERGRGVSPLDSAYKRGWRCGLSSVERELKEIITGRRLATK